MCDDYRQKAEEDARDTVSEYQDEILEKLIEDGKASDDLLNDYGNGDAYHHESHVDKFYSLLDAAELIDQLSEHEETDSGLWDGQQPKEAIGTCAAFTYGNAVYSEWTDLIDEINGEAETIIDDYDDQISNVEEELEKATDWESSDVAGEYDGPTSEEIEERIDQLKAEKRAELEGVIQKAIDGEL